MSKLTFITGGARSGKSSYAVDSAVKSEGETAFIATCAFFDKEMEERIARHRKERPDNWHTYEESYGLTGLFKKIGTEYDIFIIDCVTLFISNLMLKNSDEELIINTVDQLLEMFDNFQCRIFVVSNEVGMGLVPDNPLGRKFRDIAGNVNKMIAAKADGVFFIVSGLPLKIK